MGFVLPPAWLHNGGAVTRRQWRRPLPPADSAGWG